MNVPPERSPAPGKPMRRFPASPVSGRLSSASSCPVARRSLPEQRPDVHDVSVQNELVGHHKTPVTGVAITGSGQTCSPCQLLRVICRLYQRAEWRGTLPAAAQRYRPASYASYLLSASAAAFLTADVAAVAFRRDVLRSCFTVERAIMWLPMAA